MTLLEWQPVRMLWSSYGGNNLWLLVLSHWRYWFASIPLVERLEESVLPSHCAISKAMRWQFVLRWRSIWKNDILQDKMKLILIDLKYTLLTSVGSLYQEYHAESKNESYTAEKETYRENKYYTTEKETYRELSNNIGSTYKCFCWNFRCSAHWGMMKNTTFVFNASFTPYRCNKCCAIFWFFFTTYHTWDTPLTKSGKFYRASFRHF